MLNCSQKREPESITLPDGRVIRNGLPDHIYHKSFNLYSLNPNVGGHGFPFKSVKTSTGSVAGRRHPYQESDSEDDDTPLLQYFNKSTRLQGSSSVNQSAYSSNTGVASLSVAGHVFPHRQSFTSSDRSVPVRSRSAANFSNPSASQSGGNRPNSIDMSTVLGVPTVAFTSARHTWTITHVPEGVQQYQGRAIEKSDGVFEVDIDSEDFGPELCVTAKNEKGMYGWFAMGPRCRPLYVSDRIGKTLESRANRDSDKKKKREQELKDNKGNNVVDDKRLIFHPVVLKNRQHSRTHRLRVEEERKAAMDSCSTPEVNTNPDPVVSAGNGEAAITGIANISPSVSASAASNPNGAEAKFSDNSNMQLQEETSLQVQQSAWSTFQNGMASDLTPKGVQFKQSVALDLKSREKLIEKFLMTVNEGLIEFSRERLCDSEYLIDTFRYWKHANPAFASALIALARSEYAMNAIFPITSTAAMRK